MFIEFADVLWICCGVWRLLVDSADVWLLFCRCCRCFWILQTFGCFLWSLVVVLSIRRLFTLLPSECGVFLLILLMIGGSVVEFGCFFRLC